MRAIILSGLMAGVVFGIPAASAAPTGNAAGAAVRDSTLVQQAQSRGRYCDELRRACLNKDRLGERGEGNCARYRSECRSGRGYRSMR